MSGTAIGRIVWKEFKQIRVIALAFIVVAFLTFLLMWLLMVDHNRNESTGFFASLWLFLFGALCGSILFATEKEHGTFGNLQLLPLSWRYVLAGKLIIGLGFVLAIPLLIVLIGVYADWREAWQIRGFQTGISLLSGTLVFFSSGLVWSLFCQRVIVAALMAIATASFVDFVSIQMAAPSAQDYFAIETYFAITPHRLLAAFFLLLAPIPLSRRWWQGATREARQIELTEIGGLSRAGRMRGIGRAATIVQRLFWQSMRSDSTAILIMIVVCGGAIVVSFFDVGVLAAATLFAACLVASWIGGVFVFSHDQQRQNFFFSWNIVSTRERFGFRASLFGHWCCWF